MRRRLLVIGAALLLVSCALAIEGRVAVGDDVRESPCPGGTP